MEFRHTSQLPRKAVAVLLILSSVFVFSEQTFGTDDTDYITSASINVDSAEFEYMVNWNPPVKEELRVAFKHSGEDSSGMGITYEGAGGLNICSPMDGNTVYGFFKDGVAEIDLRQQKVRAIETSEIEPKLTYLGRFEVSDLMSPSKHRLIVFLKPTDAGSGPKNPCSLSAEAS